MPVSRHGTWSRSRSIPRSPLAPISAAEEVSPAAPMSWIAITAPERISSRQASSSSFSAKGSPTWTVGRFSSASGLEGGRCHARAMDAVAPGFRAEIDDRIADSRRGRSEDRVPLGDADRHRVDEDVAVVAPMKAGRAADRRHAERIAVAADPRDDPRHQTPGFGMIGRAEAQEVERGDRPRAHGEHVAQMPPTPVAAP